MTDEHGYRKVGNQEYRDIMLAQPKGSMRAKEFPEGHPAHGYCNLLLPSGEVVVLMVDA